MSVDALEVVDLAALLHDIDDWKYQVGDVKTKRAEDFLRSQNVEHGMIVRVLGIINAMGFKEELGGQQASRPLLVGVHLTL